ncbi:hypothetical protein EBZ80_07205 [bacterium]|nr:hypothetical protein [bacterium]
MRPFRLAAAALRGDFILPPRLPHSRKNVFQSPAGFPALRLGGHVLSLNSVMFFWSLSLRLGFHNLPEAGAVGTLPLGEGPFYPPPPDRRPRDRPEDVDRDGIGQHAQE